MGAIVVSAYFLQGKYGPIIRLVHQWTARVGVVLNQHSTLHRSGGDGGGGGEGKEDSVTKVNSWMELNEVNKGENTFFIHVIIRFMRAIFI